MRKAFDCVNHTVLLGKLYKYGVRGPVHSLIKSYLSGRDQYVTVNDTKSDVLPVTVGVPQGSVLGPLFFNIFINDMSSIPGICSKLFADDAVFYVEDDSFDRACESMSTFTQSLSGWLNRNKILAHQDKTKLMLVTPRPYPNLPDIYFNNTTLEWVGTFKYLGITLDRKLSFKEHISITCNKLARVRGVIYSLSGLLPLHTLRNVYYSLAYPHVIQSIVIWGGASDCHTERINIALNKIMRTMLRVRHAENNVPLVNTSELYRRLQLFKYTDIYINIS